MRNKKKLIIFVVLIAILLIGFLKKKIELNSKEIEKDIYIKKIFYVFS